MNSTFHQPLEATLVPITSSATGGTENLFVLSMKYKQDGHFQVFVPVYVPVALQAKFAQGPVKGLHLETLNLEGFASASLPGKPPYLMVGVIAQDGSSVQEIPREIAGSIRRGQAASAGLGFLGLGMLLHGWPWLGALSLSAGAYLLRAVQESSFKPFHCLVKRSG